MDLTLSLKRIKILIQGLKMIIQKSGKNLSLYILKLTFAFIIFSMRRSRAEVRYGKPAASDEIEPLGSSNSKWDEESSSENEDEIFDINFLKNTRLQKHSDNV